MGKMKSLLQLHIQVLQNAGHLCSTDVARDSKTVTCRWEDEGDSFLTITLPLFAKALERGLEVGHWPERHAVSNWKHRGGLPVFLRGFLLRVFDSSGQLLDDPCPDSIRAVRQFCLLSQKVERECTPDRVRNALDGFVKTDSELMYLPARLSARDKTLFESTAHRLFGDILAECEKKIASYDLVPKHGPGATADRLSQKEKRDYGYWTEKLESVFPSWRYTRNTGYSQVQPIDPSLELPARVVTVPKTQATPRVIAMEPSTVQYAQQGLKRELYELIGRSTLKNVLGFQDQTRNRDLARLASIDGSLATLDLSEASDRVHWYLIFLMVRRWPHIWDYVRATRSSSADVSGEVIPLQKFASMGSALTFPFEAMVFTILAAMGLREAGTIRSISPRNISGRMSVYGDDIIVPVDAVDSVIDYLERFGAKVNRRKSFWIGKFRESCGAEYYNGHDVSIVRVRHELPSSRNDAAEVAACVDLRNRFLLGGYWSVVGYLDGVLDKLLKIPYAHASHADSLGFIGRLTFNNPSPKTTYNADLQREEVVVPVLKPHSRSYRIDGEAGLLEWFHASLRQRDLVDRFDSQERSTSFSIKRRRTPIDTVVGGTD